MGVAFVALATWGLHREDPTLIGRAKVAFGGSEAQTTPEAKEKVVVDFYYLIQERCPNAFPRDLETMIKARDLPNFHQYNSELDVTVGFGGGKTRYIDDDEANHQLLIGPDLLMGRFGGMLGWGGLFVTWFTLWPFFTGGRSPGKAMLRIKVIRLDGSKLRLWDCFARAGGYSASAATLMLGFLEAIWHPNRQAIHDKIAGTVVIRG